MQPDTAYVDALRYLRSLPFGPFTSLAAAPPAVRGLQRMRRLLDLLGNPHLGRRTIHVAGSKGKGSTAVMAAALIPAAGRRTGLFTSPHLHRETERYRVDGDEIPPEAFTRLVAAARPAIERVGRDPELGTVSPFELRTALAFLWFREQGVEVQVIEAGLGGTLDATNALDEKDVCVLTPVSLEHTEILGSTVAEITADKAGILRPGVRAVMGLQRESAADVFRAACAAHGAPLEEVAAACRIAPGRIDDAGQAFRLETPRGRYDLILPLLGRHQQENAATALLAAENLAIGLTPAQARGALAAVRWPGRLEVLRRRPLLVVDGAHNADSARRLVQALRAHFSFRRAIVVTGMGADKDRAGFARELAVLDPEVIATRSRHERSADPEVLAAAFAETGAPVRQAPDVASALDGALAEAGPSDLVCVTGSLYLVAEARAWILGVVPDPESGLH